MHRVVFSTGVRATATYLGYPYEWTGELALAPSARRADPGVAGAMESVARGDRRYCSR